MDKRPASRVPLTVLGPAEAAAPKATISRRAMLSLGARSAGVLALGGALAAIAGAHSAQAMVWQIDPDKCIQCGKCATACVLEPSAVKCLHAHAVCGYCKLCTGFFEAQPNDLNTGAENQLCPTGAIRRTFIEDPYFEYTIDRSLCVGCARCVKGCNDYGNGSLFLQIDQSACVRCNQCAIARVCPADAISRVPAHTPYRLRTHTRTG